MTRGTAVHSTALRRVAALFVTPAVGEGRTAPALRREPTTAGVAPPARTAVVAGAGDVAALGAVAALRGRGRGPAVVAVWTGGSSDGPVGASAPAWGASGRVAASLRARELSARATGRLVVVTLPPGEPAAVEALGRVEAACVSLSVVVAVGGARTAAWDRVLATFDDVLVHHSDTAVRDLVTDRLSEQGIAARAFARPPAAAVRRAALAGFAAPARSRRSGRR